MAKAGRVQRHAFHIDLERRVESMLKAFTSARMGFARTQRRELGEFHEDLQRSSQERLYTLGIMRGAIPQPGAAEKRPGRAEARPMEPKPMEAKPAPAEARPAPSEGAGQRPRKGGAARSPEEPTSGE